MVSLPELGTVADAYPNEAGSTTRTTKKYGLDDLAIGSADESRECFCQAHIACLFKM